MANQTEQVLGNLVNYKAISEMSPLQPSSFLKEDISEFILSRNYDRGMDKVEQTRDRYDERVRDLDYRIRQSADNIRDLEKTLEEADPGTPPPKPGLLSPYSDSPEGIRDYNKAVAEYEDRVEQVRRLQERTSDRIADATDRHGDMVDTRDDVVREAKQMVYELTDAALLLIDDDIVAVLDRATQIAIKLSDSEDVSDVMAAVEVCFIELKIFNVFEDYIEGNEARRAAREKINEVYALCTELIKKELVRVSFKDFFYAISSPIEKNAKLYTKVTEEIEEVDQESLGEMTQSFQTIFGKHFSTNFRYEHIIDPVALDNVVADMHKTIDALKNHISQVSELDVSTQATAEAAVVVHQELESTLATMKSNVEEMHKRAPKGDYFRIEMLYEAVVEHPYYLGDLRTVVTALREEIANHVGGQFDTLFTEADDRYSVEKTEAAIKAADLLRLQAQRDRVAAYISELSTQIKGIEADVKNAGEVPKKNADRFKSSTSLFYAMSCLPVLGFAFAVGIQGKIKKFAPAFRSPLEIYHKLGTEILAKNKTMQTVVLVLGAVLGLGGMGIFFGMGLGSKIATSMNVSSIAVNLGLPGIVLVLYLITWVILSSAGKTLQSYIGKSEAALQPATTTGAK